MAQVNRIRELFFEKGLKYAEISRVTGFDVKTVKKYIDMDDCNPKPKIRKPRPSKLDQFKDTIDEWLKSDKHNRVKQRHTALRVFDRLTKECSPPVRGDASGIYGLATCPWTGMVPNFCFR